MKTKRMFPSLFLWLEEDKIEPAFVKTGGAGSEVGVADNVVKLPGLSCTTSPEWSRV